MSKSEIIRNRLLVINRLIEILKNTDRLTGYSVKMDHTKTHVLTEVLLTVIRTYIICVLGT